MQNNSFRPWIILAVLGWFAAPFVAAAAELKVIDASGLVRSAKVVQDHGDIEVIFSVQTPVGTECVLKNVDGLAADQKKLVSPDSTCLFLKVPAGTWLISTSSSAKWRVRISGKE